METEVYKGIEELKVIKETPDTVFEGVKAMMEDKRQTGNGGRV